ncbi:MAG: 50S ribosomal protein L27 [Patescibacteria group bacterium]|nr:50S ribosomal protein L27 [Patescibacteria group bacterium]
MAHKKATGSKARQGSNVAGKRLGVKIFSNQSVLAGAIIVRQRGTKFHPGENVGMGRDHTLYAETPGKVQYKTKNGRNIIKVQS